MKTLVAVAVLSGSLLAQHAVIRGGGAPPQQTYGSSHGFGNVVFPGTGRAPISPLTIVNPFYSNPTTHAQRLGATVSGYPGYTIGRTGGYGQGSGYGAGYGNGFGGRGGAVLVPYAVPVYVGGYDYSYGPPAQPVINLVTPPPQPAVIINQYYTPESAKPVMRDYTDTPLPESQPSRMQSYQAPVPSHPDPKAAPKEDKATIYLIAFKSGNIHSAYGCWIEGDTLHYISTQGSHNRASLDLVDRAFSEQLNRERGIEFKLDVK